MTKEEAIRRLKEAKGTIQPFQYVNEAIDYAIKALEQQPCEDCISREWLKTAIHNFYQGLRHTPTEEDIQAYIDVAPPVTPQPKTGRWIEHIEPNDAEPFVLWLCENCDTVERRKTPYCPCCGAKMESDGA